MHVQKKEIEAFVSDFLTTRYAVAVVYLPDGATVAINRRHRELIGGNQEAVVEQEAALIGRIDAAVTPPAAYGRYDHDLNAIMAQRDKHCMISALQEPRGLWRTPGIQFRRRDSGGPDRRYVVSLIAGRRLTAIRPHVFGVAVIDCPGVEVIVSNTVLQPAGGVTLNVRVNADGVALLMEPVRLRESAETQPYFAAHKLVGALLELQRAGAAGFETTADELIGKELSAATDITHKAFLWDLQALVRERGAGSGGAGFGGQLQQRAIWIFDMLALRETATPLLEKKFRDLPGDAPLSLRDLPFDDNHAAFNRLMRDAQWRQARLGTYVGIVDGQLVAESQSDQELIGILLSRYPKSPKFYAQVEENPTVFRGPSVLQL